MKEMVKDNHGSNHGTDECYSIAESMIDEIHHIAIQETASRPSRVGHQGSLKEKLLRQIRQARKMAMMG
jgi:hypothetical protein